MLVVSGFILAGAPPSAAVHLDDDPGCGNLSPFGNLCAGAKAVRLSHDPKPGVSILGFQGRIEITLLKNPGSARMDFACNALLVATLSDPCVLVFKSPDLNPGDNVLLFCHAKSHPAFRPAVPPTGPWGCEVNM